MSLMRRLQKQLEFYLSPANVRQDVFLQQNVIYFGEESTAYFPLDLFLTFNKLVAMKPTLTLADLLKVSGKSKSLLLRSEEGLYYLTAHSDPIELDASSSALTIDAKIIYVEGFPVTIDHDQLRRSFTCFGKVAHVSMPRCKHDRSFKGFAFIEFESEEAASRAAVETLEKDHFPDLQRMLKTEWNALTECLKKVERGPAPTFYPKGCLVRCIGVPVTVTFPMLQITLFDMFQVPIEGVYRTSDAMVLRCLSTSHVQSLLTHFSPEANHLFKEITMEVMTGEQERLFWTLQVSQQYDSLAPFFPNSS